MGENKCVFDPHESHEQILPQDQEKVAIDDMLLK